jgi:hypothetical protein
MRYAPLMLRVVSIFAIPLAYCYSAFSQEPQVYLTKEQALNLVFGTECEQHYEPRDITPDIHEKLSDAGLDNDQLKTAYFFRCSAHDKDTGFALIDAEVGKHLPITYIVGISPDGKVTRVEMMVFREVRGWEVRERTFMGQFEGKSEQDDLKVGSGIRNVSGATLSSQAVAKGVKRALFLWDMFYGKSHR